jgi:hypothetical protein
MRRIMLFCDILPRISKNQDVSGTLEALSAFPAVSVSNFHGEFRILSFP